MRSSEFSVADKKAGFIACCDVGIPMCAICKQQIKGRPEYDHIIALGLGGTSVLSNLQVVCKTCHKRKTHTEDRPPMIKADRIRAKHRGIYPKSRNPIRSRRFQKSRPHMDTDT